MTVQVKKFRSDSGFETTGFKVADGSLLSTVVNTDSLRVNNVELFKTVGSSVVGTLENLSLVEFSSILINSDLNIGNTSTYVSVVNGVIALTSKTGTAGSINNMTVGQVTPAAGAFTSLTATTGTVTTLSSTTGTITNLTATNLTATNLNVTAIGNTTPATGTFTTITTDDIVINNRPTLDSHGTRKDYVDETATALAIALGA